MVKRTLARLLLAVLIFQLLYLVLANAALNMQWTQTQINELRPDRFTVNWQSAWTLWPLRVHFNTVAADGQTHNKQWQLDTPRASARLHFVPLFSRRIVISDASAENSDFRLRPKLSQLGDFAQSAAFFPQIRNRDPASLATQRVAKTGRAWQLTIDAAQVQGEHFVWMYHAQAKMTGTVGANIQYATRGGPFALSQGSANLLVTSLSLGADGALSDGGSVIGSFSLDPFIPQQNKGLKSLAFLQAQVGVRLDVSRLDFLNSFLKRFDTVTLDGAGHLEGQVHWQQGYLTAPTDFSINADSLTLGVKRYRIDGNGEVRVIATAAGEGAIALTTVFNEFTAYHGVDKDARTMLTGKALTVSLNGGNHVLPVAGSPARFDSASVTLPGVLVPDLKAYQHYLPEKWQLKVNGGAGRLQGSLSVTPHHLSSDIQLTSNQADIAFKDFRFQTGLKLHIKASGSVENKARLDFSGTQLVLNGARLSREDESANDSWDATLALANGSLSLTTSSEDAVDQAATGDNEFAQLLNQIKRDDLHELLDTMNADFTARLAVSELAWMNQLFKNSFRLAVDGHGDVIANVAMRKGWITKGSSLAVKPKDLHVNLLDYTMRGDGSIEIRVDQGGSKPDMTLTTQINEGQVRRLGEQVAFVDNADIKVIATAVDVRVGERATVKSMLVEIPAARVVDVSAYNTFLPTTVPVRFSEGEASMTASVLITPTTTSGRIEVNTRGLKTSLDEQTLSGEIDLDITINDGIAKDMNFDIAGSSIQLRDFRVQGEQGDFSGIGWSAKLLLDKAQLTWKEPLSLNMQADITMDNSRPIVALMANQRGKYGWLEKLATVENIVGEANIEVREGQLRVPYAFATSDKVDVGAKGLFNKTSHEGVLFARYRKLKGILKIKDEDRNFDLMGATRKFSEYEPASIQLPVE